MKQYIVLLIFLLFESGLSDNNCEHLGPYCSNYCNLFHYHVLCVYPQRGKNCIEPFTDIVPNNLQQQEIVDWHNRMRRRVALGLERRGLDGPQPSASNMMKMEWDPELAKIAQRTVNQCTLKHDCQRCRSTLGDRFLVGQNIAAQRGPSKHLKTDFLILIKTWYDDEVEHISPNYVDSYVYSSVYDYYAQVVWWNTRSVGCGGARFKSLEGPSDEFLIFCNYGPAGKIIGAPIYERGSPCSQCPEGTYCDPDYHGLCAINRPFKVQDEFHTDNHQPYEFLQKR